MDAGVAAISDSGGDDGVPAPAEATQRWRPLARTKTYELVVRRIKDEVFAGRLKPGDRLPGERELSEQLNVGRPSVREALRTLQTMRILDHDQRGGARGGLYVSTAPSAALSDLLGVHVALSSYSVAEVTAVRLSLETQVMRHLAEHPDRIPDRIPEILTAMADPALPRSDFHDLDAEFHVTLARAASNQFLADLMSAMRESLQRRMDEVFGEDANWPETQRLLAQEHVDIHRALVDGDTALAERLIGDHVAGSYASLGELHTP